MGVVDRAYGAVDWQCVDLATGEVVVRSEVYPEGTNNIGEFVAVIDALRYLHKRGRIKEPVYTDSQIAMAWHRRAYPRTKHPRRKASEPLFAAMDKAVQWLKEVRPPNPVLHWKKDLWGETPADFGRKVQKAPANPYAACSANTCSFPRCSCP